MPDEQQLENNYKTFSDSFIKFFLYRLIIVFTIVFTLLNAELKKVDVDINNKVERIKELQQTTGTLPRSDDMFIGAMFFDKGDIGNFGVPYIDSIKSAAFAEQEQLLKQVEQDTKRAYLMQLPFFNNTTVDLRYWIFLLPILYIFSTIFLYIITIQEIIIRKKVLLENADISTLVTYPNQYLKELFALLEIIMVGIYLYVFFEFIKYNDDAINTIVIRLYIFILYFSIIYALYVGEKMKKAELQNNYKPNVFFLYIKRAYAFLIKAVQKLNPLLYLRTGIIFLGSTLFLIMSYSTCDDTERFHAENAKKGYQLFTYKWKQELDSHYSGIFYECLYIVVLFIGFSLLLLNIKRIRHYFSAIRSGTYFLILKWSVLAVCFLFTVYFGFYHLIFYDAFIIISVLLLLHWHYNFNNNFFSTAKGKVFATSSLASYIIYLLPFIFYGTINAIKQFRLRNGWVFFFAALWLFVIGIVFLEISKKNKSRPV
jgi:hypothetical protein